MEIARREVRELRSYIPLKAIFGKMSLLFAHHEKMRLDVIVVNYVRD